MTDVINIKENKLLLIMDVIIACNKKIKESSWGRPKRRQRKGLGREGSGINWCRWVNKSPPHNVTYIHPTILLNSGANSQILLLLQGLVWIQIFIYLYFLKEKEFDAPDIPDGSRGRMNRQRSTHHETSIKHNNIVNKEENIEKAIRRHWCRRTMSCK